MTTGPREEAGLLSKEFAGLNLIFFLAAAVMALFFQFQHYLIALSVNPHWFGFLIAADSLASFVLQPILAVRLNGRNGRPWIVASLLGMAAALIAYNFALDLVSLAVVRIFHGAAFVCLVSALMAMIVLYIPRERSGQAFGLVSVVRLLPYAIVPPLVGVMGETPAGFRHVLMVGGVVMVLCPLAALVLKPASQGSASSAAGLRGAKAGDLLLNLKDRKVAILLATQLLLYSSYTVVFFFIKEHAHGQGIDNPGFFFTIATAATIGVRLLGNAFFDRYDKALVAAITMIGLAACYLVLGYALTSHKFYVLAFLCGLGWGIVMPMVTALMFDVSPPHLRAMNLNLSLLMLQGGFFIGPFAGGLFVSKSGYGPLFLFVTCITVLGASLVWTISKRSAHEQ